MAGSHHPYTVFHDWRIGADRALEWAFVLRRDGWFFRLAPRSRKADGTWVDEQSIELPIALLPAFVAIAEKALRGAVARDLGVDP